MSSKPPNIVFIMADDHASKSISAYGHGMNSTPHMDRLAKEGIMFNHCYVTNSLCTPSRAAILTGMHNHTNNVMTLNSTINNRIPNVAKHLRAHGNYQTAIIGKWHLGEGPSHEPAGFDHFSVIPSQGEYWDPHFITKTESEGVPAYMKRWPGYVTDIITDKSIDFMKNRDKSRPFFLMVHHKAPHRAWEYHPRHEHLYKDRIALPDTFTDDYKNRAKAAAAAKMRVADDLTYFDLGLAQPQGGRDAVGPKLFDTAWNLNMRKVPNPEDVTKLVLRDSQDGTVFTFRTRDELAEFKFQRYMQRYLRTIQCVDDGVGRTLDWLEREGIADDTVVVYTSDQGFFLGEHGWCDKRYMYEESFQMPFLIRYPREIRPGGRVNDDIICNVDFAPTFCDLAGLLVPSFMQGVSFGPLLRGEGKTPESWKQVAFHRYWMHNDSCHGAYAHYGVRDRRYKIIYWYNDDLGIEGANPGGSEPEWELFDCQKDPLELLNVYHEEGYKDVVKSMTTLLETKMMEIGDIPLHPRF